MSKEKEMPAGWEPGVEEEPLNEGPPDFEVEGYEIEEEPGPTGEDGEEKVRASSSTQYLRCEFTDAELKEKGAELARAVNEKDTAESELKNVSTQIKHRISVADGKIRLNSEHIRSGYEMRNVECRKVFYMERDLVEVTRNDTGDVVSQRPLTEEERQFQLNLETE